MASITIPAALVREKLNEIRKREEEALELQATELANEACECINQTIMKVAEEGGVIKHKKFDIYKTRNEFTLVSHYTQINERAYAKLRTALEKAGYIIVDKHYETPTNISFKTEI